MAVATTRIPEEMLIEVDEYSRERFIDRAASLRYFIAKGLAEERKEQTLKLYEKGEITIKKAARMMGITFIEMLDLLKRENIQFNYTEEDLAEDFRGMK